MPGQDEPLQGVGEGSLGAHGEVLTVVVHPPEPILRAARAPDEPVQDRGEQRGGVGTQHLEDVRVYLEERVETARRPQTRPPGTA